MLLTKKSEYALLSLLSISKHKEPINVDILSKELQISKSFLGYFIIYSCYSIIGFNLFTFYVFLGLFYVLI